MDTAWTLELDSNGTAWLVFDQPGTPVNTFTRESMEELDGLVGELENHASARAAVFVSGKPIGFIAGADINELAGIRNADDACDKARAGHAVFDRIERLSIPTIAVIHGACMGGGLEMALACDFRLVTDHEKTSLAAPEVKLGILPGWGGTQRLPRLVGLQQACMMILTGRSVRSKKALRIGLADATVAHSFLRDHTRTFIDSVSSRDGRRRIHRRRRRARGLLTRLLDGTAPGRRLVCAKARRDLLKKTNGNYPAPLEALDVLQATAGRRDRPEFADLEIEAFGRLAATPISRNLVWLFQASRRLNKPGLPGLESAVSPASVGVVGAGAMGAGIAWACSHAGLPVRLKDIDWPALTRGMGAAAGMYRSLVKRRRMTPGQVNLAMHRIAPGVEYTGFDRASIVVEAVIEDMDLKRRVLTEIESHVGPDTVICTNTSSLPLRELAESLKDPSRFVGLHFFNPVNRMPLVEVVPCETTSDSTLVAAVDLVRRLDKMPLVVGDCPGFLVNRILLPYLIESAWMCEEGAEARRIDEVLERFGMPMGPLALVDEVGLDVGYKVARQLEIAYGTRMQVPEGLGAVADDRDTLGRKTGRGFYIYRNGKSKPNPRIARVLAAARVRDGVEATELSDEVIVDRAVLIMVNEAARCLEEQVVDGAEALDMAMVMGTGFAPFRGGVLHYADTCGVDVVRRRLEELADQYGDRFRPAPLIERLADDGSRFFHDAAA